MKFEKGQSGNPGGRPRGDGEVRDLARQQTATALRTLIEIAEQGQNESARVAAASAILDRGWGKPAVPVIREDQPTVITFNFGTELRPPSPTGNGTARTIEAAQPALLSTAHHQDIMDD